MRTVTGVLAVTGSQTFWLLYWEEMAVRSREKKEINYGAGNNPSTRWWPIQVYSYGRRNDPILYAF